MIDNMPSRSAPNDLAVVVISLPADSAWRIAVEICSLIIAIALTFATIAVFYFLARDLPRDFAIRIGYGWVFLVAIASFPVGAFVAGRLVQRLLCYTDSYVIRADVRQILRERSLLTWRGRQVICKLDDVVALEVFRENDRVYKMWHWKLRLRLRNGEVLKCLAPGNNPGSLLVHDPRANTPPVYGDSTTQVAMLTGCKPTVVGLR